MSALHGRVKIVAEVNPRLSVVARTISRNNDFGVAVHDGIKSQCQAFGIGAEFFGKESNRIGVFLQNSFQHMARLNGLLLIALRHLGRVLHDLLRFDGVVVNVHGCCQQSIEANRKPKCFLGHFG